MRNYTRIKELREKEGIDRLELAERCSTTPDVIRGLEEGTMEPYLTLAIRIARGLGVDVIDLVDPSWEYLPRAAAKRGARMKPKDYE